MPLLYLRHACLFCLALVTIGASAQLPNIILGRPTDVSVTASVLFQNNAEHFIEYGNVPGVYPNVTTTLTAQAGVPDEVDLTDLVPDTRYYYRIRYRPVGGGVFNASLEHAFHTQRAPGSSFTFTIEADEHLYDKKGVENLYRIALANEAADAPDFMLSLGDIFGDDHEPYTITSGALDTLHYNYRPLLGEVAHSVPFYVCLGNHEGENDFYLAQNPPNNLGVWGTQWRKVYYPNPFPNDFYSGNTSVEPWGIGNPENYYAWTWGDALFVVLDVYRDQCDTSASPGSWNWSLGWPQYLWLRNTLQGSSAQHKFVFAHHVRGWGRGGAALAHYYEWGGFAANGTNYQFGTKRPGWDMPIQQLFETYGVDIFFQGHDHLFAREELNGVVYQEVPMPSDSTYTIGVLANADAYTADTLMGSGHLRVNVSANCVTVDFVRAWLPADTVGGIHHNREVAFSYSLGACDSQVEERGASGGLSVYPNPADQRTRVRLPAGMRGAVINVCDATGRHVVTSTSEVIATSSLPSGVYTVCAQSDTERRTTKLIVDR